MGGWRMEDRKEDEWASNLISRAISVHASTMSHACWTTGWTAEKAARRRTIGQHVSNGLTTDALKQNQASIRYAYPRLRIRSAAHQPGSKPPAAHVSLSTRWSVGTDVCTHAQYTSRPSRRATPGKALMQADIGRFSDGDTGVEACVGETQAPFDLAAERGKAKRTHDEGQEEEGQIAPRLESIQDTGFKIACAKYRTSLSTTLGTSMLVPVPVPVPVPVSPLNVGG
jgi:hypothetical protein